MVYVIIGVVILIALLPFSIKNKLKDRQKQIEKKAKAMGVDLTFTDRQK